MEKFPQPAQKNESFERLDKIKKALFGVFLAALPETAEAIELPPGTDWFEGVAQFRQIAETEAKEYAGLYIGTEHGGEWTNPVEGEKASVRVDPDHDIIKMLQASINDPDEALTVCVAHNHPHDEHHEYQVTPSVGDITGHMYYKSHVYAELEGLDMEVEIFDVMFNEHGAWYYSVEKSELEERIDSLPEKVADFEKYANRYSNAFYYGDEKEQTLAKLQYKLGHTLEGIKTRFVTYEQLAQESPYQGFSE